MAAAPRSPRHLATFLVLALCIAVSSAGVVLGRQADRGEVVPAVPAGTGAVDAASAVARLPLGRTSTTQSADESRREHTEMRPSITATGSWTNRSEDVAPPPAIRAEAKATIVSTSGGGSGTLSGRNRVWIPALGIKRSVSGFACSSKAYPGNRVYRWGCAGRNNVYLFGHAYSVFKPLHDAYVRGRLKKGMKVLYADSRGRVSTYKVIWWRVVRPDRGGFAFAAQSRPSMTLQTCVGARSQYRLVVRLVRI